MAEYAVEMHNISKQFPRVLANDDVTFLVKSGEIHALVGENGAGKSTLMNLLYGLLRPDNGTISINGETMDFSGPGDAIDSGIGMVHQHFMLIPPLTVAENVILGHLIPAGKAAPPRPRSPDCVTASMTCAAVMSRARSSPR